MPEICEGVSFDTVAREWRLKWATESGDDKAPLVAVQKVRKTPACCERWLVCVCVHLRLALYTGLRARSCLQNRRRHVGLLGDR